MGQSLGFIAGPMGGGYIASLTGFGMMFAVMGSTAILSILVMAIISRRQQNIKVSRQSGIAA